MPIGPYVELLKLRIGMMIALSAVMGYVAIAKTVRITDIVALTLAMVAGSAAASVVNNIWDRDIDGVMRRTQRRPLVTGAISGTGKALLLAAFMLAIGISIAVAAFNVVVAVHLGLGAFFYGVVYTIWLKRRTWLNIVIGGAAGSFAVLAGGAAWDPNDWLLPLLLAVTLFLWTPSHFWALAIVLKEDYARARLPMLPVLIGDAATARVILGNSILLVASAALPWALGRLGGVYAVLSSILGLALLWANWQLVRCPDRVWARRNFLGSMQYLAGLFAAVAIDVHVKLAT